MTDSGLTGRVVIAAPQELPVHAVHELLGYLLEVRASDEKALSLLEAPRT